jgi:hypothetical protein
MTITPDIIPWFPILWAGAASLVILMAGAVATLMAGR